MRTVITLALAAAAISHSGAAFASASSKACTAEPKAKWMTLDAIKAKAEEQGYKIQKSKMKATCAELYALDKSGKRVELFVDPSSGKIVGTEAK